VWNSSAAPSAERRPSFVERACTMGPDSYETFFLASAGAGGAFVGLLFVAISIGPQRTFGDLAGMGAPRQHLAEATFLTLINGFVVSSVALIPGINVGWIALVLGIWGLLAALRLASLFARFHRHSTARLGSSRHLLRVTSLSLVASVVFAIEVLFALRLILQPGAESAFRGLALVIIGLYALAMLRAWTLLGDPQHGWSGWLNPLQDLPAPGETDSFQDASS
jgi:hypothetical protein